MPNLHQSAIGCISVQYPMSAVGILLSIIIHEKEKLIILKKNMFNCLTNRSDMFSK